MSFTLLIGNNFITNSPKAVKFNDRYLFKLDQPSNSEIPLISIVILDKNGNQLLVVESNQVKECSPELTQKKSYKEHVLVVDKSGEIIFESRILDKKTIIVSGIFHVDNLKLTITQNYIILPTEKWIMHDRINSYNKEVSIDTEGIKVLQ
ncbi:hypothetical protein [Candidatus Nitrosocosmicus sp. SS]|jgi:hypothetical protein|uniref:hypothetical protein n=1 Tax=Candidatus Nitrosocosmicus agrestis TaxID=2563600 RepID=UPI00122DFE85|nr:hypothetical protein [Candidatus Nitrosocosmicus sp. SS]KAA2281128.1 hypothetical protein F1Z66_09400 [Candidatus Nitrosocosmicus sp. SS]KAF0869428.1 hypothetical protein E5N71_05140 [Candidatus Nitrosocosmicus sp. SS]MDR4491810.1 hypothetical protein [Candidatus Nitrosocosmicus sp.]